MESAATTDDPHQCLPTAYTPQPPPPPPFSITAAFVSSDSFRYSNSFDFQTIMSKNILSRFLSVLIIALCLLFFLFFVLWIVFKPRTPGFEITSAYISPINFSVCSGLFGKINLSLEVENPNYNIKVYYRRIHVQIMYGEYIVSKSSLPNFNQKGQNVVLWVKFNLTATSLQSNMIGAGFGDLEFEVRVLGFIKFGIGRVYTSWRRIKVFCDDVKFGTLMPGTNRSRSLIGGRIGCDVG